MTATYINTYKMFTLRIINKDYTQRNYWIGDNYAVYIKSELHLKEYLSTCETLGLNPDVQDGILLNEDGKWFSLFKDDHYYVMTESGKTFERINL